MLDNFYHKTQNVFLHKTGQSTYTFFLNYQKYMHGELFGLLHTTNQVTYNIWTLFYLLTPHALLFQPYHVPYVG